MTIVGGLFTVVGTTELPEVDTRETKNCFVGERWRHRDDDFDRWLPEKQPKAATCVVTTLAPSKEMSFRQWAAAILGVPAGTSIEVLSELLKERRHTMTIGQAHEMAEQTAPGPNTSMSIEGSGNFFFTENKDGSVSVGCLCYSIRVWFAYAHRLDDNYSRSAGNRRLLICNFEVRT